MDLFASESQKDAAGALEPGTVIGERYVIDTYVASGGMGFIYRAHDPVEQRTVALKVMRERLRENTAAVKRFRREAETVARLYHPNTISLYDYGADQSGMLYIVMEWLEGEDLGTALSRSGPVDALLVARLGAHVARSLQDAHRRGVIHRDLKPENIFLTMVPGGFGVKVLDFGIAKIVDGPAQTQITQLGMVCGTPEFMSPEQARGEELDGRSDIYALGCVFYKLLVGLDPFPGESPLSIIVQHIKAPFPGLPKNVPVVLDQIVRRSVEKSPGKRYKDAEELAEALEDSVAVIETERELALESSLLVAYDTIDDDSMPTFVGSAPSVVNLDDAMVGGGQAVALTPTPITPGPLPGFVADVVPRLIVQPGPGDRRPTEFLPRHGGGSPSQPFAAGFNLLTALILVGLLFAGLLLAYLVLKLT